MIQHVTISALVLCLWALSFPANVRGGDLARSIDEIVTEKQFATAHWGVLVQDLKDGTTLYERNAAQLFAPASTTKLYSTATALQEFGADYRFITPVYRNGPLEENGALAGDLILVASGDLTMGGRTGPDGKIQFKNSDHTYANFSPDAELTDLDPLTGLNSLARQIRQAGVRRVRGEVLIDDRLFDKADGTGSGPGRITPILINDNVLDFRITPKAAGAPAEILWRPQTAAYSVDAQIDTVAKGGPLTVEITSPALGRLVVHGSIPEGHRPVVRIHEVEDAASFARALLIEALRREGVVVDASPLRSNRASLLPPSSEYSEATRVALLESPRFAESARLILKVSHNLHASTLPLLVASRHGQRTLAAGLRLQHDFLAGAGVDVDSISFAGGAGGARGDYVTPVATVQLLRHMTTHKDHEAYRSALPVLGIDGTLASAVAGESVVKGKAFAKTGTLVWENTMNQNFLLTSKALAGYLTTPKGKELAVAIFVNNVPISQSTDSSKIGRVLGRICEVIYANAD